MEHAVEIGEYHEDEKYNQVRPQLHLKVLEKENPCVDVEWL